MPPRTALITGATGFVGSHLAERLSGAGWQVRALVRRTSDTRLLRELGATLVEGGLDDVDALRRGADGADTVFHLAAVTQARDEEAYRRANAEGTAHVVRGALAAAARPRRLVYLSSYAACGPSPDGRARGRDEPPAPLTAYGRTKLAGERAAAEAAAAGVEVLTLRAPAVYGPRGRDLLTYFRLVSHGVGPFPGGPDRRLHLLYAPDLALALLRAADAPPGTYAVAEPAVYTWRQVVDAVAEAVGRSPLRIPLPPGLARGAAAAAEAFGRVAGTTVAFNREKAEEMLAEAWVCDLAGSDALLPPAEATPLREGTRRTAQWYRDQGWL